MKVESFRRLAFRKAWRRTPGNDGLARVAIPMAEVEQRLASHPHGSAEATGDGTAHGARGGTTPAGPADGLLAELRRRAEASENRAERAENERDNLAAEVIKERERRARAEGEAAGLKETVRLAEEGRRDMQMERDAARSQAQKAEAERGALAEARLLDQLAAQEAATEAAAARNATTRAAAQAAEEHAARRAAETARDAAAAEAEAARIELADLTAGGPLRRAWRAFAFGRGRP